MESSIQIEERAAAWLARRDSSAWGVADEAAFNAWLEQSTLHVVAFVRLDAAWKHAKRLRALSSGVRPGEIPAPEEWQLASFFDKASNAPTNFEPAPPSVQSTVEPQPPRSAAWRGGSAAMRRTLAACLLIALAGGTLLYGWSTHSIYRTPVGGTASVPISDGSQVVLNTDSRIRLDITETERRIELQKGEAYFDVAKDPRRPFVVGIGSKRVVVMGTQFSVRREGGDIRVFVTEGKVRIEDERQSVRDQRGDGAPLMLTAGSIARAGGAGMLVEKKSIDEVVGYLSWRTGYLFFRDTPLADAVAEFNRYNTRKVVINDPAVAAIRVSGKFRANQFDAFVRVLEDGFPIRARHLDDRIVLTGTRGAEEAAIR